MTAVRRPSSTRTRLAAALLPTLLAGALLAGCGDETDETPSGEDTTVETSPSPSDSPSEDTSVPGANSPVVKDSIADLAERQEADEADIEVVAVEAVTWNDGSIGCAKPGRMYTQATIEGQRITLRLDGKDYAYHSAKGGKAAYCAKPTQ